MPATPIRRPRALASIAAAVLGLALLAGCTGQKTPGDYSDSVERNFLRGCTSTARGDGASATDAKTFCGCVYDALSDDDGGVDFDEFKQVNDDQTEDPGPLPESFTEVYEGCAPKSVAATETEGSGTDGSSTTTEADADEPGGTTTTEG